MVQILGIMNYGDEQPREMILPWQTKREMNWWEKDWGKDVSLLDLAPREFQALSHSYLQIFILKWNFNSNRPIYTNGLMVSLIFLIGQNLKSNNNPTR